MTLFPSWLSLQIFNVVASWLLALLVVFVWLVADMVRIGFLWVKVNFFISYRIMMIESVELTCNKFFSVF